MKRIFTILAVLILTVNAFGQIPDKISYQAVIRNRNNALVSDTQVGMRISILQGSATGTVVYSEVQTPKTNSNGLIGIEIGGNSEFNAINWAAGPYFLKTETDPAGGMNYTVPGTSQLLSVPYALHSKSTESLTGRNPETDPVFNNSVAKGITATDTSHWNNPAAYYNESDPVFDGSVAKGITAADTSYWNLPASDYTETDPVFDGSVARGITAADTSYWNTPAANYTETDPLFIGSVAKGISAADTARPPSLKS